jgi:hypothetical protein
MSWATSKAEAMGANTAEEAQEIAAVALLEHASG